MPRRARLGLDTAFIVRTAGEWTEIVAANPFRSMARDDPGHLVVMALKYEPDAARLRELEAWIPGPEKIAAAGRELYITYPDGMGTSKLTGAVIERRLGTRGTARNWNTVTKLAALVDWRCGLSLEGPHTWSSSRFRCGRKVWWRVAQTKVGFQA